MTEIKEVGSVLAWVGTVISITGVLANNIMLDHTLAMQIWFLSNPVFLAWAIGGYLKKWDGGLSYLALVVNYSIFTVTNVYGVMQ